MAERPLGSFDSLKFCGFWGAMPPRPPSLPISYLWLLLISNFDFLTMHRVYVIFRPDHLNIWFGFEKKTTRFFIRERINNMALFKENKNKLASKEKKSDSSKRRSFHFILLFLIPFSFWGLAPPDPLFTFHIFSV